MEDHPSFKYQTTVIFGIMKDGSLIKNSSKRHLFHMQKLFLDGANDISEIVNIIYRFLSKKNTKRQLVEKIVIKKLQIEI